MKFTSLVLRLVFGILTIAAIGWQLGIHLRLGFGALNFFSYFTNISNLFAASVLLLGVIDLFAGPQSACVSARIRYIAAVNMIIVGIVFALLLRSTDLGSLRPWINVLLHYVMPCIVLLDWLLKAPTRLTSRDFFWALMFPAFYVLYVLLRGHATGWYPYPFLNPTTAGGYGIVTLYCLGIALTFAAAAGSMLLLANRGARSQPGI